MHGSLVADGIVVGVSNVDHETPSRGVLGYKCVSCFRSVRVGVFGGF